LVKLVVILGRLARAVWCINRTDGRRHLKKWTGWLNLWVENFVTSVGTLKTMNYCAPPEDKWILVDLLNNPNTELYISHSSLPKEKADFIKLNILLLAIGCN